MALLGYTENSDERQVANLIHRRSSVSHIPVAFKIDIDVSIRSNNNLHGYTIRLYLIHVP